MNDARRCRWSLLVLALVLAPLAAQGAAPPDPGDGAGLGRIVFPTSARSAPAQRAFVEGVLWLHSFEYDDAREAFRRARTLEPGFAMATWGEALTWWHPIWRREEPEEARAALRALGATRAERASAAPTDVERGWLDSVEVLFGEGTRAARWTGYRDALARLHRQFPHDVEVGAMLALAELGTSFGGRDTRVYMRAAGIAQPFWRRHPDHPGLLHYLIHCYDDPIHAPLGLEMARAYDKIAPAAGHALHMPSHIYVALGMWDDAVRANIASFAAGDARRERKGLGVDERNWHACQWLAYGHLQRGEIEAAAALLGELRQDYERSRSARMRAHAIVMRAAHVVDGGGPGAFGDVEIDHAELALSTVAADHFARGWLAHARRDAAALAEEIEAVRALAPADPGTLTGPAGGATCCAPSGVRAQTRDDVLAARVVLAQLEGLAALLQGNDAVALAALEEACAREDAMGLDFGPPVIAKPANEQRGELLLALGRPADAVAAFDAALLRAPRRARSMLGRACALRDAGEAAAAAAMFGELALLWQNADAGIPGLADVRRAAEPPAADAGARRGEGG